MRGAGLGLVAVLGCAVSEPNPGHCFNGGGDAFCRDEHGSTAAFCAVGSCEPGVPDGCVPAQPDLECWSPCGQGQTAEENDGCDGVAATGDPSTSTSTSGSPSTTDPITTEGTVEPTTTAAGCVPEDCTDPERPFCADSGICVACSGVDDPGGMCQALDATRPVCDGSRCVACTEGDIGYCGGNTPICDAANNTCIACTRHAQCPDSACALDQGSCLDGAPVLWVDGAQPCPGTGAEDDPFCSIQDAIDAVGGAASGVIRVAATGVYNENLSIDGGRTIALLPDGNGRPVVDPVASAPTLEIDLVQTTAYVEGFRFENNNAEHAIQISGATVVLDRVQSVRNGGGALYVGSLSDVLVRNGFMGANVNDVDSIVVNMATLELLYTTVFAGVNTVAPTRGLACTGVTTVTVRNSFFASTGSDPEAECPGMTMLDTASESLGSGNGNVQLGAMDAAWFANISTGDFHLDEPPAAVRITATWTTGDPSVDIDGDPRPMRDGESDAAGGDR